MMDRRRFLQVLGLAPLAVTQEVVKAETPKAETPKGPRPFTDDPRRPRWARVQGWKETLSRGQSDVALSWLEYGWMIQRTDGWVLQAYAFPGEAYFVTARRYPSSVNWWDVRNGKIISEQYLTTYKEIDDFVNSLI